MKIPIDDPYYDRLHTFLSASNNETDRGRALVAASLIVRGSIMCIPVG